MQATVARRRIAARSWSSPRRARRAAALHASLYSLSPRSCDSWKQERRLLVCEAKMSPDLVSAEEHTVRKVERGARWQCDGGAAAARWRYLGSLGSLGSSGS